MTDDWDRGLTQIRLRDFSTEFPALRKLGVLGASMLRFRRGTLHCSLDLLLLRLLLSLASHLA